MQQPVAQFCGLHNGGGVMQPPVLQTCLDFVQSVHAAPAVPHAPLSPPGTHWPFEQQPVQLLGPQGGGPSHAPPTAPEGTHDSPIAMQFSQVSPPEPHAVWSTPLTHWSP